MRYPLLQVSCGPPLVYILLATSGHHLWRSKSIDWGHMGLKRFFCKLGALPTRFAEKSLKITWGE